MEYDKNVIGTPLETCSLSPLTGFNRNGNCQTAEHDIGVHGVCSEVTEEFLSFTRDRGNDLSSPNETYGFPGLKPRDRWVFAPHGGRRHWIMVSPPPIVLSATSETVLRYIGLDDLLKFAVDVKH